MTTTTTTTTQKQQPLDPQMPCMNIISYGGANKEKPESPLLKDEEVTKSALATFLAKEDEIERMKDEMRSKIQAQLGRVEEETKRLVGIRGEVEAVSDPMRKEAAIICKRIDIITRDLKPLGMHCHKKEKEYKEAIEALNEKNKEKVQLLAKLAELVTESENLRFKKLEELFKNI